MGEMILASCNEFACHLWESSLVNDMFAKFIANHALTPRLQTDLHFHGFALPFLYRIICGLHQVIPSKPSE
jgi:hypothetical protein